MFRSRSLLALVLLLPVLLTSACATSIAKKAPNATKAPTATPVLTPPVLAIKPARPLVWAAHQLPFAASLGKFYNTGLSFSQADGATAYACVESSQGVRVWITRDRAVHWMHGADVQGAADSCRVIVDDARPETAILLTYHAIPANCMGCFPGDYHNYLTRDAGSTWTPLAAPADETPLFGVLKTKGNVTYATAATLPHSHCGYCYTALYASKDDLRTWTRIDAGIQAVGRSAVQFWVNSAGDIMAETTNNITRQDELWLTPNQGVHWKAWSDAQADSFIVPAAQNQRFWWACGVISGVSSADPPDLPGLICTVDGGTTWTPAGGSVGTFGHLEPTAQFMAPDGAALRAAYASSSTGAVTGELQRAISGKQGWESLGALPASGAIALAAGGQTGVLWVLKPPANYGDALTTVYTATYP